jgi:hypothetical protein
MPPAFVGTMIAAPRPGLLAAIGEVTLTDSRCGPLWATLVLLRSGGCPKVLEAPEAVGALRAAVAERHGRLRSAENQEIRMRNPAPSRPVLGTVFILSVLICGAIGAWSVVAPEAVAGAANALTGRG